MLSEGRTFSEKLRNLFDRIADWFMQIYGTLRGKSLLNDGIVRAFDSLMEENPELAERYRQQQETQETNQETVALDTLKIKGKVPSVSPDVLRALEPLGEGQTATIKSRALEGEVQYEIGKTGKKGHGLLHIIEQRMVKDGKSLEEAVDIAIAVAESVADGELTDSRQNTRHLEKNNIKAIVALNDENKNVITGYEIKEDEVLDADRRSRFYSSEPHVRSEQMVASLKERLHQLNQSVNPIRFQSQMEADNVGAALYTINKESKRYRDLKRDLYDYQKYGSGSQELADEFGMEYRDGELGLYDSVDEFITKNNIGKKRRETQDEVDFLEARLEEEGETLSEDEREGIESDIEYYSGFLSEYDSIQERFDAVDSAMYNLKERQNQLYTLKEEVIKALNPEIVEYHEFEGGDIRPLYRIGNFSFHGEAVDELPDGIEAYPLGEISSENKLEYKMSVEQAESLLNSLLEKKAVLFQSMPNEESEYIKQVNDWKNGKLKSTDIVKVGRIGVVMKALGAPDLEVVITQETLDKATRPETDVKNGSAGHELPLGIVKKIPRYINDPVMVFKSRTQTDSMVFLSNDTDREGHSVVVAIHLNKRKGNLLINQIASLYGKNNDIDFVKKNIREGNLLYLDEKRSLNWSSRRGLQLSPLVDSKLGYMKNVIRKSDIVKSSTLFQAVYHGSPYIIRKPGGDVLRGEELGFDHNKMGTGEGAQAYGWGTYVTQVEGIADGYARKLARMPYTEEETKRLAELDKIYSAPSRILASIETKKDFVKKRRSDLRNLDNGKYEAKINKNIRAFTKDLKLAKKEKNEKDIEFYQDLIDTSISQLDPKHKEDSREAFQKDIEKSLAEIESLKKDHKAAVKIRDKELESLQKEMYAIRDAATDRPAANVYSLDIPDEDRGNYISWITPIDIEQLRAILRQAKKENLENFVGHLIEDVVMNDDTAATPAGKWLYELDLQYDLPDKKERSLFLNRAGITGISYPAQLMSGGREDGAKNYVIFNEDDISVTDWHAKNINGITLFQRKQITDEFNRIANDFDENDFIELGTGQFGKEYAQGEDSPIRAAKFLLAKKSGIVKNAFRGTKLGDVGLAYGDEKNGLFHIIAKHIFELDDFDGITEAVETIENVLRNGTQKENNTDKNKIIVVNNNYRVVLGKNKQGNYVVTSYDFKRKEGAKRRNSSDITLIDRDAFMKDGTLVPSEAYLNNTTSSGNVNILFQSVYHGSGASFDAFDSSYMGTGEGAQAFGWGHYVTQSNGIARSYAENIRYAGNDTYSIIISNTKAAMADNMLRGKSFEQAKKEALDILNSRFVFGRNIEELKEYQRAHATVKEWTVEDVKTRNLYTVEIPDDTGKNYLYWDKPMGDNFNKISSALEKNGFKVIRDKDNYITAKRGNDELVLYNDKTTFGDMYHDNFHWGEWDFKKEFSSILNRAGFVGINYPANSLSGGSKTGERNFVIFNDNDLAVTDNIRYQAVDLTAEFGKVKSGEITAEDVEKHINSLIGQAMDTATEPLKVQITAENTPHIITSNLELKKGQKKRHNAVLSTLGKIINNAKYSHAGDVDLSHNTRKKTIEHKQNIEQYVYFYSPIRIGDGYFNVELATERVKGQDPDLLDLYNVRVKRNPEAAQLSTLPQGQLNNTISSGNVNTLFQMQYGGDSREALLAEARGFDTAEGYIELADLPKTEDYKSEGSERI